jgi:hypothetical protein
MDRWQPELRDPEYGYKLLRLQDRLQENPGRSLMVLLGSSRAALGFSPEAMSACLPASQETPLIFNFGMTGSGPMIELLVLERLLAAGIEPQWLVIEILPPLLHQEGPWIEPEWLDINRLGSADLPLLMHNTDDPWTRGRHWVRSRLVPWYSHRFCFLSRYAADWLPSGARQDGWQTIDDFGWLAYVDKTVTPEKYQKGTEFARKQYGPALEQFHVSERPNRNLRQIFDLCRKHHIRPLLLIMPEGTEFRSFYAPETCHQIDAYLGSLNRDYGVPLIDARCWLPNSCFYDSHHLLPSGAAAFSRRFAEEVMRPLLDNRVSRSR